MYSPWITNPQWNLEDLHLKRHAAQRYQRPSLVFQDAPGIHTLLGPRRVGKSTQFKLWCRDLLKHTPPQTVAYLDAERFESWQDLLQLLEPQLKGLRYLFLDEVTAVKDWERTLKILSDSGALDDICVWLTGSNAFDLKNSGERLPGRRGKNLGVRDVELLPLCFAEFNSALREHGVGNSDQERFELHCLWGGYPMAVSECLLGGEPSYDLLQELLDVVLGLTSKKHRSPRLSGALAERLWQQLGGRSSYQALAKYIDAGSHPIVRQYVEILEGCYTLITVERFNEKTKGGILKKEKKFYFLDPLVMGALVSWVQTGSVQPRWLREHWADEAKQGAWIENMVASELRKRGRTLYYDERSGQEVDFVFRSLEDQSLYAAVEVKRSTPTLSEVKGALSLPRSEVWVGHGAKGPLTAPFYAITERLLSLATR